MIELVIGLFVGAIFGALIAGICASLRVTESELKMYENKIKNPIGTFSKKEDE